jgi:hypothetical protein
VLDRRQVDDVPPRQRDVARDARPLGADGLLGDLHDDLLPLTHDLADRRRFRHPQGIAPRLALRGLRRGSTPTLAPSPSPSIAATTTTATTLGAPLGASHGGGCWRRRIGQLAIGRAHRLAPATTTSTARTFGALTSFVSVFTGRGTLRRSRTGVVCVRLVELRRASVLRVGIELLERPGFTRLGLRSRHSRERVSSHELVDLGFLVVGAARFECGVLSGLVGLAVCFVVLGLVLRVR